MGNLKKGGTYPKKHFSSLQLIDFERICADRDLC
jgi:hypothetical protein